MKQHIGTMKTPAEAIDDLDVLFVAVYNLIYEKMQEEPNKGIVVSKGNPNQRRATWDEVMRIAHQAEDYFTIRKMRTGCDTCENCSNFDLVNNYSRLGNCKARNLILVHSWGSCKTHFERKAK